MSKKPRIATKSTLSEEWQWDFKTSPQRIAFHCTSYNELHEGKYCLISPLFFSSCISVALFILLLSKNNFVTFLHIVHFPVTRCGTALIGPLHKSLTLFLPNNILGISRGVYTSNRGANFSQNVDRYLPIYTVSYSRHLKTSAAP